MISWTLILIIGFGTPNVVEQRYRTNIHTKQECLQEAVKALGNARANRVPIATRCDMSYGV